MRMGERAARALFFHCGRSFESNLILALHPVGACARAGCVYIELVCAFKGGGYLLCLNFFVKLMCK